MRICELIFSSLGIPFMRSLSEDDFSFRAHRALFRLNRWIPFFPPAELILGSRGDPEEAKNPSGGRILRLSQIQSAVYTEVVRIVSS